VNSLSIALRMTLATWLLTGLAYPFAATGLARLLFPNAAAGSLVQDDSGRVVGSRWIGQAFAKPGYLQPRPSAAGAGYDAAASSGSNYGPTNEEFLATVADRVAAYREENELGANELVPVDAVTASASGLDPHISVRNAELQAPRVASARGIEVDEVLALIEEHTTERPLGMLGDPGVNVLELNLSLDG
jgi:potassium-transporting ATPase KdpC subunit